MSLSNDLENMVTKAAALRKGAGIFDGIRENSLMENLGQGAVGGSIGGALGGGLGTGLGVSASNELSGALESMRLKGKLMGVMPIPKQGVNPSVMRAVLKALPRFTAGGALGGLGVGAILHLLSGGPNEARSAEIADKVTRLRRLYGG